MFTIGSELRGYFDYDGLGLYLRAHETAEIDGVVVDLRNILGRRFLCDGLCCLRLPSSTCSSGPQIPVRGDCCQGPWVPLSTEEHERIAKHLEGILPHMAPEARAFVEAQLAKGKERKATFCRPVRDREGRDLGVTAAGSLRNSRILPGQGVSPLGGQTPLLLAFSFDSCSSLRQPFPFDSTHPRDLSVYPGTKRPGHEAMPELSSS